MDRFEAMSVLLAVVEAGSLSAGARRLYAPLATVSRKVGDLEKHLGVQLVLRTSRGLALTQEGRAFVAVSRRILEEVDAAERQAAGDYGALRGGLHVTAPITFGERHLLPIALEFLKEQPEINLRLTLADRQISLADDHIDVALRIGHLADSALIATRVGAVRPGYLRESGLSRPPRRAAQAAQSGLHRRAAPKTRGQHDGRRHSGSIGGYRHYPRAVLPGLRSVALRRAAGIAGGVRTGTAAGERAPCGRSLAAEGAVLPRLDRAPPARADGSLASAIQARLRWWRSGAPVRML